MQHQITCNTTNNMEYKKSHAVQQITRNKQITCNTANNMQYNKWVHNIQALHRYCKIELSHLGLNFF